MLCVLDYVLVYSRSSEIDINHKNEMEISGSLWFHPKWKICWATPNPLKSPRQIRKRLRQCWAQSNSIQQENNQIQRHSVIHLRNEEAPTPAAFVSWFFPFSQAILNIYTPLYSLKASNIQNQPHLKKLTKRLGKVRWNELSFSWGHCVPLSPLHDFLLRRSWVQSGL